MSDNGNATAVDKTYLIPKTFYFFIEHTDSHYYTQDGQYVGPNDRYHVEVALYRLNEKGAAIDTVEGKQVNARVFRTWVTGERKRFSLVPGKGKTDFSTPDMLAFPSEGCAASDMPALVTLQVPELEQDRNHIGYARIFDGYQWGPWARIPQTRLEIVDEKGVPLGDVRVSNPKPKIDASVPPGKDRIDRTKANEPIAIEGVAQDYVPIQKIYLDGRELPFKQKKEGNLYLAKFKDAVPKIVDGCQRIEILAENVLDGRSQVVKLYHPDYHSGAENSDDRGKVLTYYTDDAAFKRESEPEEPQLFRVVYHAIPCRLPSDMEKSDSESGEESGPKLPANLLIGTGGNYSLWLRQMADAKHQKPYVGPNGPKPKDIKLPDATRPPAQMKVIVTTQVQATGPWPDQKHQLAFKEVVVPIDPKAWTWQSEALLLIPGSGQSGNALPAKLGDLFQAHIKMASYCQEGSSGDVPLWVSSPKCVAAGARPVTKTNCKPLTALKNGDVIRVDAFTIKAQPKATVEVKTEHKHEEDNKSTPPYALVTGAEQEVKITARKSNGLQGHLGNLNDKGDKDTAQRDEPKVPTANVVDFKACKLDQPASTSGSQSSSDSTTKSETPDAPGRVKYRLISKADQPVRLLTQEYFPRKISDQRKAKGEKPHQILPYGFLSIAVRPKGAKASDTPAVQNRYRSLEIIKRWYLGDQPSIQPALAGTNPRVGGPGTHRVQGLAHKLRDGSIYVHNGEFFQAAEDLHIKGKVMDLTFRRTYLSHSLFTSDLGRNWDWMGNMRLVELLNGQMLLMNGESLVESYKAKTQIVPSTAEGLSALGGDLFAIPTDLPAPGIRKIKKGEFDYSKVYKQRQYASPAGAYRSLLWGKPVALGNDKDADLPKSEEARFYLVGKHGTIWTFVQDVRFRGKVDSVDTPTDAEKAAEHEPIPGVRSHWLLVSIHDRRQANCIKLQRDASGLVRGVIDDYGRATRVDRSQSSSAVDRLLNGLTDVAGRNVSFQQASRALAAVPGVSARTASGGSRSRTTLTYQYAGANQPGPRHKLSTVLDTMGDGVPILRVTVWKSQGQAIQQKVGGRYKHDLTFQDGGTVTHVESFPGYELRGTAARRTHLKNRETFKVTSKAKAPFAEVASRTVFVQRQGKLQGHRGDATTAFVYNSQGELTRVQQPSGAARVYSYVESGAGAGNLISTEQAGTSALTLVGPYDARFNLPNSLSVTAYIRTLFRWLRTTRFKYDAQGNCIETVFPDGTKNEVSFSSGNDITDDGLPSASLGATGLLSVFYYYRRTPKHLPGDGHDHAAMLSSTQVIAANVQAKLASAKQRKTAAVDPFEEWGTIRRTGRPSPFSRDRLLFADDATIKRALGYRDGMVTSVKPDLLDNPTIVVDPDGTEETREFNELGLLLKDSTGEQLAYWCDNVRTRTLPLPGGTESKSLYVYDALGEVLFSGTGEQASVFERDVDGNPVLQADGSFLTSRFLNIFRPGFVPTLFSAATSTFSYDERGLLLAKQTRDRATGKGIAEAFAYDQDGKPIRYEDPCGWREAWKYDRGGWLTHHMDKRGAIHRLRYGHGGEVRQETVYEPTAITSANTRFRQQALQGAAAPMDLVRTAARTLSTNPEVGGTVLSDVSYSRDRKGRVEAEYRLWQPVGGRTRKTVASRTIWTAHDLPRRQWLEVWGRQEGPKTVRQYDPLGRILSEVVTGGKDSLRTSWLYGVHGLVRTKAPNGYTTQASDGKARVSETWDNTNGRVVEKVKSTPAGIPLLVRSTFGSEQYHAYDASLNWTGKTLKTWGPGAGPETALTVGQSRKFTRYGQLKQEAFLGIDRTSHVIQYHDHCLFGPRKHSAGGLTGGLGAILRFLGMETGKMLETDVVYDGNGGKIAWRDANGTLFNAQMDGYGGGSCIDARHAGTEMHRRAFLRDAAGRVIWAQDHQKAVFSEPGKLEPNDSQWEDEVSYDTLGYAVQERQEPKGLPIRTTAPTCRANGLPETVDYPGTQQWVRHHSVPKNPFPNDDGVSVRYAHDGFGRVTSSQATEKLKGSQASSSKTKSFSKTKLLVSRASYDNAGMLADGLPVRLYMGQGTGKYAFRHRYWCKYTSDSRIVKQAANTDHDSRQRGSWRRHIREDRLPTGSKSAVTENLVRSEGLNANMPGVALSHNASTKSWSENPRPGETWFRARSESGHFKLVRDFDPDKTKFVPKGLSVSENVRGDYTNGIGQGSDVHQGRYENRWSHVYAPQYGLPLTEFFSAMNNTYGLDPRDGTRTRVSAYRPRDATKVVAPITRFGDRTSHQEPGGLIARNAFGEIVRLTDPEDTDHCATYRYDAFGRLTLKETPATLRTSRTDDTYAQVIDVADKKLGIANHWYAGNVGGAVHCVFRDTGAIPSSRGPRAADPRYREYVIRIHRAKLGAKDAATLQSPFWKLLGRWGNLKDPQRAFEAILQSYKHVTIESKTGICDFGIPLVLENHYNMTFRSVKLSDVTVKTSSNIEFDGCELGNLTIQGSCPSFRLQNCKVTGKVTFKPAERQPNEPAERQAICTTAVLIHNDFTAAEYPLVMPTSADRQTTGLLRVGFFNNLVHEDKSRQYRRVRRGVRLLYELFSGANIERKRGSQSGYPGSARADMPNAFSECPPVLWDRDGVLRNPVKPTAGPSEKSTFPRYHRYIYRGQQMIQRESFDFLPSPARVYTLDWTRFIEALPGGPMVFLDSNGVMDVQMKDRMGRPWYMYRAREGDTSWANSFRTYGFLKPVSLPGSKYIEYPPWLHRVLEPDFLLGRRGTLGWDGNPYARGILLNGPIPVVVPEDETSLWIGFVKGVGVTVLWIGGIMLILIGVASVFGAPVAIGLGIGLFAAGAGLAGIGRAVRGQTAGQVVGGALADITGVSGIYAGVYNEDIATGKKLGYTKEQRGFAFGQGTVQLAAVLYGTYRLGKWAAPRVAPALRAGYAWTRGQAYHVSAGFQRAAGGIYGRLAGRPEFVIGRGLPQGAQFARALKVAPFKGGYRFWVASSFARSQMGWSATKIAREFSGIDFRFPVPVRTLPAGTQGLQYVRVGGYRGNWASLPGQTASEVGLAPYFHRAQQLQTVGPTRVLESIAADAWDTWTVKPFAIKTIGGGTQWLTRPEAWTGAM